METTSDKIVGSKKLTYSFLEWQIVKPGKADDPPVIATKNHHEPAGAELALSGKLAHAAYLYVVLFDAASRPHILYRSAGEVAAGATVRLPPGDGFITLPSAGVVRGVETPRAASDAELIEALGPKDPPVSQPTQGGMLF